MRFWVGILNERVGLIKSLGIMTFRDDALDLNSLGNLLITIIMVKP